MNELGTSTHQPTALRRNPMLARVLARMPLHVQGSFTPEQIEALDAASSDIATEHLVALRGSLPGLRTRYYLAFFIGVDRRKKLSQFERLLRSGMRQTTTRRFIIATFLALVLTLVLFSLFCGLYVLKSVAGINVFEGHSFLHEFFYKPPGR